MIKNKDIRLVIYTIIMALVYPLIFIILFSMPRSSGSTDAAGRGMEALGILIECIIVSVVYFIISIIFLRIYLRTILPSIIALLLSLLLAYCYSAISDFIFSLPKKNTVYYEDGKVMQEGKTKSNSGFWVGWVKSYRRDGTIWKEAKYPVGDDWNSLIYAKYYYGDGTLKSEGYISIDDLVSREGEWKFYKPDGSLDDIRSYDKNNFKLVSSKKYQLYTDGFYIFRVGSGKPFTGTLSNTPVVYLKNYEYEDHESLYPRENEDDEEEVLPELYTCKVKDGVKQGNLIIRYARAGYPLAYKTVIHKDGNSWEPANVYYPNGQIQEKVTILNDSTRRYDCYYQDSIKHRPHGVLRFKVKYKNDDACDTAYWYNMNGKIRAWAIFEKGEVVKRWPY